MLRARIEGVREVVNAWGMAVLPVLLLLLFRLNYLAAYTKLVS